ncbi:MULTISPECIES: hypothetical protein [unclassified Schlesneria]|uniref:hypothetical protein n=1 Tax=Schlesneria TaxID=656899 RepID=UPI002F1240A8
MNRLWFRSIALGLVFAQAIAFASVCRAIDSAPGERLLPKDTLLFFSIADVPEFGKQWEKSSMGQLLRDPQMAPFLEDVHRKIDEASGEMEKEVGVSIKDLTELPQGEVTFAMFETPARKLGFVLLLEYGSQQATIDKLLKKMDEALEKEEAEHATEEFERVNIHVYTLKNPEPDNPFKTITYFADKSFLVFSNDKDALKSVLERWEGDSEEVLAQNNEYKYIQSQCSGDRADSLIKWYLNPFGLIQTGITAAQATFPQAGLAGAFLPMFGVNTLTGWGGSVNFEDSDLAGVASTYIYTGEKPTGLLGLFQFPAAQLVPPNWVPADIGSYSAGNWNVNEAYRSIETLVDQFQGRGATARFLDSVAEKGPMIHPKKDLLDHLDGKIHILQSETKESEDDDGAPTPMILAGFGLKDAGKMKKTLAAAVKAGDSNIESREFNGEIIYEISPPNSDQPVSIAITEGQLVVTNDTPLLEGMMRGQASRTTLVDSADYKQVSKHFPAKASMISFQRTEAQFKTYYNMLKNSDNVLEGIDVSKLPPFEVIAKYFPPSGGYTVPDARGAKSVTFSLKQAD